MKEGIKDLINEIDEIEKSLQSNAKKQLDRLQKGSMSIGEVPSAKEAASEFQEGAQEEFESNSSAESDPTTSKNRMNSKEKKEAEPGENEREKSLNGRETFTREEVEEIIKSVVDAMDTEASESSEDFRKSFDDFQDNTFVAIDSLKKSIKILAEELDILKGAPLRKSKTVYSVAEKGVSVPGKPDINKMSRSEISMKLCKALEKGILKDDRPVLRFETGMELEKCITQDEYEQIFK